MKVVVQLGRQFAKEAGFSERAFALPPGATAQTLLEAVAKEAPRLSCIDETSGVVDLALANLSVNGRAVSPLDPEATVLHDGDQSYFYGTISGG